MAAVTDASKPRRTVMGHSLYVWHSEEAVTTGVATFPRGPQASPSLKWELLVCLGFEKSPRSYLLLFKDLLEIT